MLNLNEFAKEIHANACDKGFWDEPRPFDELCALMISELSEALEEARAGRPMEYFWGSDYRMSADGIYAIEGHRSGHKPEGIAVEMADCAIRIMDYLGSVEFDINMYLKSNGDTGIIELPEVFMYTTSWIVDAWERERPGQERLVAECLTEALGFIMGWFKINGLDFEAIARRKHEYNKTRPYKHGKEF